MNKNNKNNMKHLVLLFTFVLLFSSASYTTYASAKSVKVQTEDIHFEFNGVNIQVPEGQHVFAYKGSTYMPLRLVSSTLQKNVTWDGKNKRVTVSDADASDQKPLSVSKSNLPSQSIVVEPIDVNYVFNGQSKDLDQGQTAYMLNGTIYVPVRFLSESLGFTVIWNAETMTIIGKSVVNIEEPILDEEVNIPAGKSYETLINEFEANLAGLKAESESVQKKLTQDISAARDLATIDRLLQDAEDHLNTFAADFERIATETENLLKDNSYNTDKIQDYRDKFAKELEAQKKLLR